EESSVRSAQNGSGRLDVVGDANTRLERGALRESVVIVGAQAEIEIEIAPADAVLNVAGFLLDVGAALERKRHSATAEVDCKQRGLESGIRHEASAGACGWVGDARPGNRHAAGGGA